MRVICISFNSFTEVKRYEFCHSQLLNRNSCVASVSVLLAGGHRLARAVLHHLVEVDAVAVGQHVFVLRVVNVALARLLLTVCSLVLVTRDTGAVRVLATVAVRINVAVLAVRHAVRADRLLLERAVVVLEAPRDAAVFVVVPVPPQNLWTFQKFVKRHLCEFCSVKNN